jgi:hypothetical protein
VGAPPAKELSVFCERYGVRLVQLEGDADDDERLVRDLGLTGSAPEAP